MNMKDNLDIRSLATLINAKVNTMCNATTLDEVTATFLEIKDYLIELYKRNVDRTKP